jgi:hypothetical protein
MKKGKEKEREAVVVVHFFLQRPKKGREGRGKHISGINHFRIH